MIERTDKEIADAIIAHSIDCLNAVVEVLKPDYILFTSLYSYQYYSDPDRNPKYKTLFAGAEGRVKVLAHPNHLFNFPEKNKKKIAKWERTIDEVFDCGAHH